MKAYLYWRRGKMSISQHSLTIFHTFCQLFSTQHSQSIGHLYVSSIHNFTDFFYCFWYQKDAVTVAECFTIECLNNKWRSILRPKQATLYSLLLPQFFLGTFLVFWFLRFGSCFLIFWPSDTWNVNYSPTLSFANAVLLFLS